VELQSQLNDDEVIDNTSNGGQNYRLYFDQYTGSKYHLTDGIPAGQLYSFYSGCSVILRSGGDDAGVDWLVKGHETTASFDSDLANDATPVATGNVYGLAAEILPGGSKLVVAGTAFSLTSKLPLRTMHIPTCSSLPYPRLAALCRLLLS